MAEQRAAPSRRRSLFYCLWLMVGTRLFSTDPLSSLLHAGTGINKGFILPFIAMECVRGEKDLRRLVWACVLACFWQGLDGVWQVFTGRDFIMGYELNAGRLTGSLGDYTVGNYIALALIPAFGLWFILRRGLDAVSSVFLCLTVFWPAFFLLPWGGQPQRRWQWPRPSVSGPCCADGAGSGVYCSGLWRLWSCSSSASRNA